MGAIYDFSSISYIQREPYRQLYKTLVLLNLSETTMPRVLVIEKHGWARSLIEHRFDGELSIEPTANVKAAVCNHNRDPFDLVVWDTASVPSECPNSVRTIKKILKN